MNLKDKYYKLLKQYPQNVGTTATDEQLMHHADHMAYIRETMPYQRNIPEDVFCTYVLPCFVNDEPFSECTRLFYDELHMRIKGMSLHDAIIEVNFWCAENVRYRFNNAPTESALNIYMRGYGRCGEESTFAVMALRSVGIPARQCYAVRWSHCDDNHAWVEAFTGDGWHYLGACEAEPILDKGWFTNAASRAMLIRCRAVDCFNLNETTIAHEHGLYTINRTAAYADTVRLFISVTKSGSLASNAYLRLEILNYNTFMPILETVSDDNGCYCCDVGLGGVMIFAQDGDSFALRFIDTREVQSVVIDLASDYIGDYTGDYTQIVQCAPKGGIAVLPYIYTAKQRARIESADRLYNERMKTAVIDDWLAQQATPCHGSAKLTIHGAGLTGDNCGIEKLTKHGFVKIETGEDVNSLSVDTGIYRICAVRRQINGDMSCNMLITSAKHDVETSVSMALPQLAYDKNLYSIMPPIDCKINDGILVMFDDVSEPYRHIEREIAENHALLDKLGMGVQLVNRDTSASFDEEVQRLRLLMNIGDQRLPLTILVLAKKAVFAYANYNVGTIQTFIDITQHVRGDNA